MRCNFGTITNSYNNGSLSGNEYVGGVCGYNLNMITNCYYDKDKYSGNGVENNSGENIGKTTAEFKSGEIAFLLSQGKKDSVWGQLIGTNDYPVLDSTKRVYRNVTYTGCSEAYKGDLNYVYSNTEIINPIYREHDYASGGYCYVYLKNICPQNLDTMHNFTVTKGETEKTLKYSAFSYMKNILDNAESYADNQNLINLINAMYEYNQAAEAYNG